MDGGRGVWTNGWRARRLRRHGLKARTVTLKIRYGDFTTLTRACTLGEATDITQDIWQAAAGILAAWAKKDYRPLRLLGVVAIIIVGKSLAALALVIALRYPLNSALTVAASLAQIGLTAPLVGFFGGVVVSKLLTAVFNGAGAGFPDAATVIKPRTLVVAVVIGFGVTYAAMSRRG